jgi:putative nucleotidyltransferase with HDIG domain
MIPDTKECIKILEDNDVAANIIEHCKKVSQTAVFLARELKKTGEKINIALLEAAALLHDLDKLKTLKANEQHGKVAYEILKENYPEVAELVKKHNLTYILDKGLQTWEEKVLNLSDARVLQDEIVPLSERFEYIRNRYPDVTNGRRPEMEELFFKLEKEIFKKIKLNPVKLAKTIEEQKQKQKKLKQFRKKQKEQEIKEGQLQEEPGKPAQGKTEEKRQEETSEPVQESSGSGKPLKQENN